MNKRFTLILLAALLVACNRMTATPPAKGQNASPETDLEAVLEMPAMLSSGAPVVLTFTLINHTDASLYVLKWYTPLEGLAGEILSVERDGQAVPYQGILASRSIPSPEAYVLLESKGSVSATVDLSQAYDFAQAGEYTIEFLSPKISCVARTKAEMAQTMDDLGPVPMPSNPVQVTITGAEDTSVRRTPAQADHTPSVTPPTNTG
jgi:peptidyl-Lys metalloendopeptidase